MLGFRVKVYDPSNDTLPVLRLGEPCCQAGLGVLAAKCCTQHVRRAQSSRLSKKYIQIPKVQDGKY